MDTRRKLMTATVLFDRPARLDMTSILACLNDGFSDLLGTIDEVIGAQSGDRRLLEFDDGRVSLTMIEGPILGGWDHEDGPAAHAIVTLYAARLEPLHAATVLTAFASALAQMPGASAVLFGEDAIQRSAADFVESARQIASGLLPVELWINSMVQVQDGLTTVVTQGMGAFRLHEIEAIGIPYAARLVLGRVLSLAGYLMRRGMTIDDGDFIGYSQQERIRVGHGLSAFRPGQEVLRLQFEKLLVPV